MKDIIRKNINVRGNSMVTGELEKYIRQNSKKPPFYKFNMIKKTSQKIDNSKKILGNITPQEKTFFENPSIGFNYVKKNFPESCDSFRSYRSSTNKFDLTFQSKNFKDVRFALKRMKTDSENKYDLLKNGTAHQAKMNLKWATIKWLMNNKKGQLEKLLTNHKKLLELSDKHIKKHNRGYLKEEFIELIQKFGIGKDHEFIGKLFWVFDIDGSGEIEYKEIVSGLEMFRESESKQKIKAFFELCDEDNSGTIDKNELYTLMKKNIINSNERINLKRVIDKIFKNVGNFTELTFQQFSDGCEKNPQIYEIVEKNLNTLKDIDLIIDNGIKIDFLLFKPEADNRLRKVFNIPEITYPSIDKKIEGIVNSIVVNKNELKKYQNYFTHIKLIEETKD